MQTRELERVRQELDGLLEAAVLPEDRCNARDGCEKAETGHDLYVAVWDKQPARAAADAVEGIELAHFIPVEPSIPDAGFLAKFDRC